MIKQIPYGLTDFGRIQKENYYYVDKTMFIKKIEMQPSYLFPDLSPALREKSDAGDAGGLLLCFGMPTSSTNCSAICISGSILRRYITSFFIMRFNFSEVSSNVNEVEESFRLHCCGKLSDFVYRYEHLFGEDIWNVLDEKTQADPGAFLSSINTYATRKGEPENLSPD